MPEAVYADAVGGTEVEEVGGGHGDGANGLDQRCVLRLQWTLHRRFKRVACAKITSSMR